MKFVEWKKWIKRKSIHLRWFIILILIRPVVDNFFYLKEVSPFYSPLYIVGVLSFLMALISTSALKKNKLSEKNIDIYFSTLLFLVILNLLFSFFIDISLDFIGDSIKYSFPFLLFFYLRRFIVAKEDLDGILYTFVLSAIFPMCMLLYELIFDPISPSEMSITRGGGVRYEGGFADIMNYAIYLIGTFIVVGYFSFESKNKSVRYLFRKVFYLYLPIFIIGLMKIRHTASWAVAITIISVYIFFRISSRSSNLMLVFVLLFGAIFTQDLIESNIRPLISKEIKVLEGEAEIDRSFDGRMSRWKRHLSIWNEIPIASKLIGAGTIILFSDIERIKVENISLDVKTIPILFSGGTHNEYLRTLFFNGILGLLLFFKILLYYLVKSFKLSKQSGFLLLSFLLSFILYSVSTNPLLYQPYIYILLSVFAFSSMPRKKNGHEA